MDSEWHSMGVDKVLEVLRSDRNGLSIEEVKQRTALYGQNALPKKKAPGLISIFINQFLSPLIYILIVAGVLSYVIGDKKDSFFIFLVITINAVIGTIQEWKAEKSIESLQKLLKVWAKVRRDGKEHSIPAEQLVPGDVVFLESGNKVPADIRLIHVNTLLTDESLLTGESMAVGKNIDPLDKGDLPIAEQKNRVFAGSVVVSGRGMGIVVETGIRTEMGKIAKAVTDTEGSKPPLLVQMEKLAKQISYVVVLACILIAAVEIFRGKPMFDTFFLITALAVSAIPEGLPAALTIALSIGVWRMSKRQVIIKKLIAAEGLGSCTCIASDKTGTLTVNKQTVRNVYLADGTAFSLTGEGYSGEGKVYQDHESVMVGAKADLDALMRAAVICNEGQFRREGDQWSFHGDDVDVALLVMAFKYGMTPEAVLKSLSVTHEIPFESEHAYAAKFFKEGDTQVVVKGATEVLLPLCKVSDMDRDSLQKRANELSAQGFRVLSIAMGTAQEGAHSLKDVHALHFLGFICLIDPLRPEAIEAVQVCKRAGIHVVMITGDHPETALHIGKDLGMARSREEVITGKELTALTPDGLLEVVKGHSIFARVSPLQKLDIVNALMRAGHCVAVTGDGVNDAPALRKAHIGVAMGGGTDIAKDVSSMIVTDNNFASIVAGVEEGRITFDNVRKVVYLLISTGLSEIILFLLALFFGLPMPLAAVQLLWLNLVTNGLQGVALAAEKGEKGIMQRKPRHIDEGIFSRRMIQENVLSAIVIGFVTFGFWWYLIQSGYDEFSARNLSLLMMVMFENLHVFNCRSEYLSAFRVPFKNNPLLILGVFAAQGLHIFSMYIPSMQALLKIQPVTLTQWVTVLGATCSIILAMELFKKTSAKLVK